MPAVQKGRKFITFYRVTSMADRLKIGFALIHREKHHIRENCGSETGQLETRITLVGDVTNKLCFMYYFILYVIGWFFIC
jgi:hypothetical protein